MFLIFVIVAVVVVVVVVLKFCCTSLAVADANLQIRRVGWGGGHPDPKVREGGGGAAKKIFFGLNLV